MPESELKPCPFCGKTLEYDIDYDGIPWANGDCYWIHPYKKGCILNNFHFWDEPDNVDAWNRRADDETD